jgi:hypothetical protein
MEELKYPQQLNFGKYVFIRPLASGGQGYVTLYRDTDTEELVAVKFDPEIGGGQSTNVLTECLLLKEISHQI